MNTLYEDGSSHVATPVDSALRRWDTGDRVGGERALRELAASADPETAPHAALVLAVRLGPRGSEAVARCREALEVADPVHGQRAALLLGWASLALADPAGAREPFRAAVSYGTDPETTAVAALLHGLVSFSLGDGATGVAAWHRVVTADVPAVRALLEEIDFAHDPAAHLTDEAVWSQVAWGGIVLGAAANPPGEPVLPRLLSLFDAGTGSRAALGLHLLHGLRGNEVAAQRAARQAVSLGHPACTAAAWLALAETLVAAKEATAAADACRRAIRTGLAGQPSAAAMLELADGPTADVPTQARTLLGVLQRDAGDLTRSRTTLTDAAREGDPDATFALAQTLQQLGENAAARTTYQKVVERGTPDREKLASTLLNLGVLADRDGDPDAAHHWWRRAADSGDPKVSDLAVYNLGLLAKDRRDLPEALRWFGRIVEAGHDDTPLAAAHLGELCYWLGDKRASLRWYRQALAHTDDPELVAEAAHRAGELLTARGDGWAARPLLERAIQTGLDPFATEAAALLARGPAR